VATGSPVRQATSLFQERFGSAPLVVASAPGRINLIGEHTDYNGGPVLPFAIERRTAAAAGHADRWEVISAVDGWVHRLDVEDTGAEAAGWTAYARAVIRTLARSGPLPRGGRIAVASAVPVGAGLSSSAALTVSLTRALLALAGRREPTDRIIDYAFTAEHDEVGVHCGRMDQTVAVLAEPGKALYFETGSGLLRLVPLESRVLVFETGVSHLLTGGELNQRRRECEVALDLLREAGRPLADLASLPLQELPWAVRVLPAPWSLRVRHVVTETARTRLAAERLAVGDLPALGTLLLEGHRSLCTDYGSSCAEADLLVESSVRHGAWGARLTGAGWGGAVIALAAPERESRLIAEVQEDFRRIFGRLPVVWTTSAAAGARLERHT
jgi:galactokinase